MPGRNNQFYQKKMFPENSNLSKYLHFKLNH